jgi:quinol---cytochrome-c reductase cytochrome c subunit
VRRALALAIVAFALLAADAPAQQGEQRGVGGDGPPPNGKAIYDEGCASCHGLDGRGVGERGPSLRGVGAAAADFYLRTGRMPLARPDVEPYRHKSPYTRAEIDAVTSYVSGLARGGPGIPNVSPKDGDVALGRRLFADSCSGCHQIVAKGGIGPGFVAPNLAAATPRQIGEAIRVGPYLMPKFSETQLDKHDIDSIARYVVEQAKSPRNSGGWGIGNLGPIPEGMVIWLIGAVALVLVARIIGERAT